MTNRIKIFVLIIIAGLILSACASNTEAPQPTQAPQATQAPEPILVEATQAGYPAPDASGQVPADPSGYPAPSGSIPALTNSGYPAPGTFNLTLADGSEQVITVEVLNSLPKEKVSFDGTELEVLALMDALKQYNVETYSQITAAGFGSAVLILTKDQVAQSYLEIQNDMIRLAVQGLPKATWVAGLITLSIQ